MFNVEKLLYIVKVARDEKWPYPKTFEAFKEAGVESYDTRVSDYTITYKGNGQTWVEPTPEGFRTLTINDTFSAEKVRDAITHHQQKKTPFLEFLADIAAAGVEYYCVDMAQRTVSYMGQNGESHVEKVPDFKG